MTLVNITSSFILPTFVIDGVRHDRPEGVCESALFASLQENLEAEPHSIEIYRLDVVFVCKTRWKKQIGETLALATFRNLNL